MRLRDMVKIVCLENECFIEEYDKVEFKSGLTLADIILCKSFINKKKLFIRIDDYYGEIYIHNEEGKTIGFISNNYKTLISKSVKLTRFLVSNGF